MGEKMAEPIWGWQGPYKAALEEKNPDKLRERLVSAEKAMFRRLQELAEAVDESPEGQALRDALNCLYALSPREPHPSGQVVVGLEDTGRRWMPLVGWVGAALLLSFSMGLVLANKDGGYNIQRSTRLTDIDSLKNYYSRPIAERSDSAAIDEATHDYGVKKSPVASAHGRTPAAPNSTHPNRASDATRPRLTAGNEAGAPTADDRGISEPLVVAAAEPKADGNSIPDSSGVVPNTRVSKALEPPVEEGAPQISVNDAAVGSDAADPVAPSNESVSTPSLPSDAQEKSQVRVGTVSVSWSTYPAIRVPAELRSETSSSGASLQIGEIISRVDPIYPEEAERQAVEGTVSLRAIIGKDGAVADVEVLNGPPSLSSAAVSAVRQWRYKPTLVGDHPVEVAEEITISFRLPSAASAAK